MRSCWIWPPSAGRYRIPAHDGRFQGGRPRHAHGGGGAPAGRPHAPAADRRIRAVRVPADGAASVRGAAARHRLSAALRPRGGRHLRAGGGAVRRRPADPAGAGWRWRRSSCARPGCRAPRPWLCTTWRRRPRRRIVPGPRTVRALSDDEIIERVVQVRGIGRWTGEMLLIQIGRPDVLPATDLGIRRGFARACGRGASGGAGGDPGVRRALAALADRRVAVSVARGRAVRGRAPDGPRARQPSLYAVAPVTRTGWLLGGRGRGALFPAPGLLVLGPRPAARVRLPADRFLLPRRLLGRRGRAHVGADPVRLAGAPGGRGGSRALSPRLRPNPRPAANKRERP